MKTLICSLILLFSTLVMKAQQQYDQPSSYTQTDVPNEIRAKFLKDHSDLPTPAVWSKVGDTYVVEYEVGYVPTFDTYSANGEYQSTKTKTLVKFFPKCVKDQLYKKYAYKSMKHAEVLTDMNKRTYYVVEVKGNKLQFDNQCQLVGQSEIPAKQAVSIR